MTDKTYNCPPLCNKCQKCHRGDCFEANQSLASAHGSLLPCPFCGLNGEAMAWRDRNGEIELIEHPNTDCILSDLRCEDVSQWNQRENAKVTHEMEGAKNERE